MMPVTRGSNHPPFGACAEPHRTRLTLPPVPIPQFHQRGMKMGGDRRSVLPSSRFLATLALALCLASGRGEWMRGNPGLLPVACIEWMRHAVVIAGRCMARICADVFAVCSRGNRPDPMPEQFALRGSRLHRGRRQGRILLLPGASCNHSPRSSLALSTPGDCVFAWPCLLFFAPACTDSIRTRSKLPPPRQVLDMKCTSPKVTCASIDGNGDGYLSKEETLCSFASLGDGPELLGLGSTSGHAQVKINDEPPPQLVIMTCITVFARSFLPRGRGTARAQGPGAPAHARTMSTPEALKGPLGSRRASDLRC